MTVGKNSARYYGCFLLLFLSLTAFTQINIIGRVVDETDNGPIPKAVVYFNNTTISTITDQQGNFNLDNIQLVNTEMVIGCAGYELLVFKPTAGQITGKRIVAKLLKKIPQKKLLIFTDDFYRRRALDIFKENFMGITQEATKSTIENEQAIYFTGGNNKSSFSTEADTPIVIINTMLGYKMHLDLVSFWYDDLTGDNYLLGYVRYESLGNEKKWIKNRSDCYYGSSMHFYRALIANELYQQGYSTFLIPPKMNASKMDDADVLAENLYERSRAVPVTAQQLLHIDSANNFSINVTGKLLVQYNKDPAAKKYLLKNSFTEGALQKGVESYLQFKTAAIGLNSAGVLSDATSVAYTGFWQYERAANVLPINYMPN